ncbi:MAG: transposase [Hyphomicrobiales bacterium]|nr:transposase [Hyphomicrobiales bacterium]
MAPKGFRTSCSSSFPELFLSQGSSTPSAPSPDRKRFSPISPATPTASRSRTRLIALDQAGVTFKWKDYRIKGRDRLKTMTLATHEFIRRFLLHVLPSGFHRIRHYGLLAGAVRVHNIERVRQLLTAAPAPRRAPAAEADSQADDVSFARRCPCCGGRMIIVETFEGPRPARSPSSRIRIDSS